MIGRAMFAVSLALAGCASQVAVEQATPRSAAKDAPPASRAPDCTATTPADPAPDLYCIELVATPDLPAVHGAVRLRRRPSPFTVAVTADGAHVHDLEFTIAGLPAPDSLGDYGTYVAWLTTPTLSPMRKLGPIGNGRSTSGTADLDKFLILISAERSADVEERTGRLVLRGLSPSTRMRPQTINELPPQEEAHGDHGHGDGWRRPPMHPRASPMPPGLHGRRPSVTPFTPGAAVDVQSLPEAAPARLVDLADGDTVVLEAGLVRRSVAGRAIAMYAFNGMHPGPLFRVAQRATITVQFTNRMELPTAVHWHGVRLANRFDGVPHVTQPLIEPGERFTYIIHFPDAGIYWYHPHHREDITQDLGLYGNLFVRPARSDAFNRVHREEVLMLDDILLAEDGGVVPWGVEAPTHALMGRFGNLMLVNGEPRATRTVRPGEIVRFYLTNAANTRTFNLSFGGAPMKLIGSDVGRYEREEWVESVVLAPAERYLVEVRFDRPGETALVNRVHAIDHVAGRFFAEVDTLVRFTVSGPPVPDDLSFDTLRRHPDVIAELESFRSHLDRAPDRELLLTVRTKGLPFGLVQALRLDTGYVNPVEWSGTMPEMDWLSTGGQTEWILRDAATGRENMAIDWRVPVGKVVKIRLRNDRHSIHPMHHPIHLHGQRFLVLAQDGVANQNLVWKDTVLLPAGTTADLLVDFSNPGRWMMHCHIAEHLEAGMHLVVDVFE